MGVDSGHTIVSYCTIHKNNLCNTSSAVVVAYHQFCVPLWYNTIYIFYSVIAVLGESGLLLSDRSSAFTCTYTLISKERKQSLFLRKAQ